MDTVGMVGLAELAYLERELSGSVEQAAKRIDADDDLARHVRTFGEEHARHAGEVDRILRSMRGAQTHVPEEFKASVRALTGRIEAAAGLAPLLVALDQAERHVVDFYQVPLAEPLADDQAAALRGQQHEEQRHVDYLENRGAIDVPELADTGLADGEGSAEEV